MRGKLLKNCLLNVDHRFSHFSINFFRVSLSESSIAEPVSHYVQESQVHRMINYHVHSRRFSVRSSFQLLFRIANCVDSCA